MHNGLLISPRASCLRRIHFSTSDNSNKIILYLVQRGQYLEALQLHSSQISSSSNTSRFIFPSLLKACTSLYDFRYGGVLQSSVIKLGFHTDPYILNSLIRLYIKSGSLRSAQKLLDNESPVEVSLRDIALWNSIIDGYFKIGSLEEGMARFRQMLLLNIKPDAYTLCILLRMRNAFPDILFAKEINGFAMRNYFDDDPFIATALIDIYSCSSRLLNAMSIFEKLQNMCNVAIWNSMIGGYCYNGLWRNGLELLIIAKTKDLYLGSYSFVSLLMASSQENDITVSSQLHCDVVKMGCENDLYVCTSLITVYSNFGCLEDAARIICIDEDTDVEIWNSMISAYVNHGYANDALHIYAKMRCRGIMPDSFTYSSALIACSMMGSFSMGTMIHGELYKRLMENNISIHSALQAMYSKLGKAKEGRIIFNEMLEKDVIAWGSMIFGSVVNLDFNEALILFKRMLNGNVKPDPSILANAINSCFCLGYDRLGICIHGYTMKMGLDIYAFTGNALIEFYSRLEQPEMARKSFSSVLWKNVAVWNSLMCCYSLNGMPDISLILLSQILQDGLSLDSISITIALSSISQMASLLVGKATHCYYIRFQLCQEIQLENSLLDMYIKCGCFKYALRIFSRMSKKDVVTWNSMISGYGYLGECHKAMDLFEEMKCWGVEPDEITFLSLISSCNHCGLIDEGVKLFNSMKEYSVEPKMDHYINMIDLFGRRGHLVEVCEFVGKMADTAASVSSIWTSLLSASRVYKNVEIGKMAANRLTEMDPGNYTQVMNFYTEVGLKEKSAELRGVMRQRELKKLPGCSWIQVKNKVKVFFSGGFDDARIYEAVECLENCMRMKEDESNVV